MKAKRFQKGMAGLMAGIMSFGIISTTVTATAYASAFDTTSSWSARENRDSSIEAENRRHEREKREIQERYEREKQDERAMKKQRDRQEKLDKERREEEQRHRETESSDSNKGHSQGEVNTAAIVGAVIGAILGRATA